MMNNYFKECVKDFKVPKGWEDISYRHDACPSYKYKELQVFVDHPDPSERENPDWKRYSVFNEDQDMLLQTDDLDEVLKKLDNFNGGGELTTTKDEKSRP